MTTKSRSKEVQAWEARHNIPLEILTQEADERYRPSLELARLVAMNTVKSYRSLDRPLVPVLNALVAKGVSTQFSCADCQILIRGVSQDAARLLEPLVGLLNQARIEWAVLNGKLVTGLRWYCKDRVANDAALLKWAAAIALLPSRAGRSQIHPAGEFVANASMRIQALVENRREAMISLEVGPLAALRQEKAGYSMHVGYGVGEEIATDIQGDTLAEVMGQFEAIFGVKEEAVENEVGIN